MIDLHTHLLPGVDDGADSLEAFEAMLEEARRTGITRIAASSHYSRSAAEAYRDLFASSAKRAKKAGIELLPAMEYDFDRLREIAEEQPLRTIGNSCFLLVDLHHNYLPSGWKEFFFRLKLKGYRILAAHPERLFRADGREIGELAAAGVSFQLNAGSLLGKYGGKVRNTAFRLIAAGNCHVFGSDAHRTGDFRMGEVRDLLRERFGSRLTEGWFEINPERILAGREPLTFRPPPGWLERLRCWIDRRLGR